jgi:hypothetical protein
VDEVNKAFDNCRSRDLLMAKQMGGATDIYPSHMIGLDDGFKTHCMLQRLVNDQAPYECGVRNGKRVRDIVLPRDGK